MQESREEIKERIKDRADIVQVIGENVDLKKSGTRFLGLCPFHGEKTPSFSVDPTRQFFHCFGCGESGDVFSYMMKYHNLDFPGALKELANRYSITLPEYRMSPEQEKRENLRKEMFALNDKAQAIYSRELAGSADKGSAKRYLQNRGITEEIQEGFGLGYAPSKDDKGWEFLNRQLTEDEKSIAQQLGLTQKNDRGGSYDRFRDRILFPIYEISGRVCGFGGRIVGEGQPKYMNSPDSIVYNKSKLLLGLYQQKEAIRKRKQAVVVEGNFDLISLVCHGCEHVVAPLGTALTREQIRLLKRYAEDVVLLFDGDKAGIKAAVRSVPLFLAEQVPGRVALLPPGHDPDTYVREYGLDAVLDLIQKAETLPEFFFAQLVDEYGLTLAGKSRIVEELRPLVKSAPSALQRSVIIAHFAEQLSMSAAQLDSMLAGEIPKAEKREESPHRRNMPAVNVKLDKIQKKLVGFMVMNPPYFSRLKEAGLRDFLTGGVGELIFLEIEQLCNERDSVEPEELLAVLPEGAEKQLVMDLLLNEPGAQPDLLDEDAEEQELVELLEWMKRESLQKSAMNIVARIDEAQRAGDFSKLGELLLEKQQIEKEVRSLR